MGAPGKGHQSPAPDCVLHAGASPAPKSLVCLGVRTPVALPLLSGRKRALQALNPPRGRAQDAAGEGPALRPRPPPTPLRAPIECRAGRSSCYGSSAARLRALTGQHKAHGGTPHFGAKQRFIGPGHPLHQDLLDSLVFCDTTSKVAASLEPRTSKRESI
ncbi:hypothetical protein NDU88_003876 [Pleurodeles waltl]|uniref:Uncharacterized protein n=1 Tax=Pleurodeles waltl TaxID=8319 RepID=A0AAV7NLX1_PLEWA|nr:hypothetical protein NDU88_003876 [Pleurodeles waltl]